MRTTQLECFASVACHRSFTKAAEELHIAQPAVSQQIQALEQELGFKLFDRTHQEVVLTRAGRSYYPNALSVLEELEAARDMEKGHCARLLGRVELRRIRQLAKLRHAGYQTVPPRAPRRQAALQARVLQRAAQAAGRRPVFDTCFTAAGSICDDERIAVAGRRSNKPFLLVHQSHPLASKSSIRAEELIRYTNIFAAHDRRDAESVIPPVLGDAAPESILFAEDQDIAWLMMRLGWAYSWFRKASFVQAGGCARP